MKYIVWLLLTFIFSTTAFAQSFRQEFGAPRKNFAEVMVVPDHADCCYMLGQQSSLRIIAQRGGVPVDGVVVRYRVGPEMFLPEHADSTVFRNGEAVINTGTMAEPGFMACNYEFILDGKRYRDLYKVAYEPERIRTFTDMPSDFDTFWDKTLKKARTVDLQPEYYDVPEASDDKMETKLVRLRVGMDKWIYGYLTRPLDGKQHPVVLVPPGAGSNKIFPSDYFPKMGMIYMKIEIHGNDQRLPDSVYDAVRKQNCSGYTGRGIAARESYYYKDVYVGCARAVDFLCSLPDWDGKNVIVTGGSQGGALTLVTAALNDKVTMCAPFYPALCDLLGFHHNRAGGWPKFFSKFYGDGDLGVPDDKAAETLRYLDVVNFARSVKVPVFMSWGYSDDTCSPTSVWAAWNEISASKVKDVTPTSGHWRFASSQEKCAAWMLGLLK